MTSGCAADKATDLGEVHVGGCLIGCKHYVVNNSMLSSTYSCNRSDARLPFRWDSSANVHPRHPRRRNERLLASVGGRSRQPAGRPLMTAPIHSRDARLGPRLVFFDVGGRRDLAQRAAAAAPGVRFKVRGAWTRDPGEPRRPLLGDREPPVGLWLWRGTREQLTEQAATVLLRFVHPLIARGLPYCLGFPFGAEVFAPRRLSFGDAAALDLEDIGRLLGVGRPTSAVPIAPAPTAACAPRGEALGVQGVVPSLVPSVVPNLVPRRAATLPSAAPEQVTAAHSDTGQPPLDPAQRAAVEHACGPARVLAPAGAGKTKTLIGRVLQLIERGTDPSGILMLAFNRKAAEQLEERLAAHGIPTTRRLGSPGTPGDRRTARRRVRRRPHSAAAARASTAPPSTPSATATSASCSRPASPST